MKSLFFIATLWVVAFMAMGQSSSTDSLPKGWWHIPKTDVRFKVGGYIKADLIRDFNPIKSPDYFDVSKIPTDGSEGSSTHFNVKETRLFLDVRTPTKKGEIKAYIESDFYGSNGAFRIRHAYIEVHNKWLIGQTWSNFMDEDIIPNTLDFEKPAAYAFARHGQIRWKQKLSKTSYLALALEEPSTNATAPSQPGSFFSPYPDFTARFRITGKWGHVQVSAFAGLLQYQFTAGGRENVTMGGLNLSGRLNVGKRDYFTYQAVGGPGSGRMRGGLSAAPLVNDSGLQALDDLGLTGGFCHFWSASLSSTFVYNTGWVQNSSGQSPNSLRRADYLAANLLWNFAPNTMAGFEYLWGKRIDKDEASGVANRIQFSIKHSFNM